MNNAAVQRLLGILGFFAVKYFPPGLRKRFNIAFVLVTCIPFRLLSGRYFTSREFLLLLSDQ